jgi:hypothetical protein
MCGSFVHFYDFMKSTMSLNSVRLWAARLEPRISPKSIIAKAAQIYGAMQACLEQTEMLHHAFFLTLCELMVDLLVLINRS